MVATADYPAAAGYYQQYKQCEGTARAPGGELEHGLPHRDRLRLPAGQAELPAEEQLQGPLPHLRQGGSGLFMGKPVKVVRFFEFCAGSGQLSKAVGALGVPFVAVDWKHNRHSKSVITLIVDLSSTEGQEYAEAALDKEIGKLRDGEVVFSWWGLPSDTASRAREIPVPGGRDAPRPLRSAEYPWGLPHLQGLDRQKVTAANEIYRFAFRVIRKFEHRMPYAIESPLGSWLWALPPAIALLASSHDVDYAACMFGGLRPKKQRLRTSVHWLDDMAQMCDQKHIQRHKDDQGNMVLHAPWGLRRSGGFAAADEAQYPQEFCAMVAARLPRGVPDLPHGKLPLPQCDVGHHRLPLVAEQLQHYRPPDRTRGPIKEARAVGAGRQPRGTPSKQLVKLHAERRTFTAYPADADFLRNWAASKNRRLQASATLQGVLLPLGAELLSVEDQIVKGSGGVLENRLFDKLAAGGFVVGVSGIQWEPVEHLDEALKAQHPFVAQYPLRRYTAAAVARNLSLGVEAVREHREKLLDLWGMWALELEAEEAALHAAMPLTVRRILVRKKLLLFRKVLSSIGYRDLGVVGQIAAGFPIVGELDDSLEFGHKRVEPKASVRQLLEAARAAQLAASSGSTSSGCTKLDQELYAETIRERDETPNLRGPFSVDELTQMLGPLWVPARRFGLQQRGKLRPIDDFSEFGQNSTLGTSFKVDLGGLDEVLGIARAFISSVVQGGEFEVFDDEGGSYGGVVHESWRGDGGLLRGCCADLKSAFRQLPRLPAHGCFSPICVFNPSSGCPEFFLLEAMAFGQGAAVYGFNRVARALDAILAEIGIMTANYVDDYPLLVPSELAEETCEGLRRLMGLLGWELKEPLELRPEFKFTALGVIVALPGPGELPVASVSNKPERVAVDSAECSRILGLGRCKPSEARRLRGRLQYAACQTLGRCGAFAMHAMRGLASGAGGARALSAVEALGLQWWMGFLSTAGPRTLALGRSLPPVVLYTDGAVEEHGVSIGGVLVDRSITVFEAFGGSVPRHIWSTWVAPGKAGHVIAQAELAPAVLALAVWGQVVQGRDVLLFVDNSSAIGALVRGYSPSGPSARLVAGFWTLAAQYSARVWLEYVPGPANLADGPSRLCFGAVERLGARRVEPSAQEWLLIRGEALWGGAGPQEPLSKAR